MASASRESEAISAVALLGVGLMGGSMGLALRRARPELRVTGFDQPSVLDAAEARGAVTHKAASAEAAVRDADLIILAAPIAASLRLLSETAGAIPEGAIVTDLCSVKLPVHEVADDSLSDSVLFVGGHPMTGSERSGIRHAEELLFENATYVLCPPDDVPQPFAPRYEDFLSLLREIGARILSISPSEHDAVVAHVSHLPQLLAVTLVNQAADTPSDGGSMFELAAGGFRDMTRIAGSPFSMWRDILAGNSGLILDALASFSGRLQTLRNRLAEDDWDAIAELFADADRARQAIPARHKGLLNAPVDVFVFVSDQPGALVSITGSLHDAGLDIRDIELLKLREGTGGTFRLGFDSTSDADAAVEALEAKGFQAYRIE